MLMKFFDTKMLISSPFNNIMFPILCDGFERFVRAPYSKNSYISIDLSMICSYNLSVYTRIGPDACDELSHSYPLNNCYDDS